MITQPLMLTGKDAEILGVSSRTDAMGVLAVWSVRARDLVPHLTQQTTDVRGFQVLVEAFRLWELYEPRHTEHAGRVDDFFVLIEQAFARIIGWHDKYWQLPGSLRVGARTNEPPQISLRDPTWHLLGAQRTNGLWGLYRGAARRAGLLVDTMNRLSAETMQQATASSMIERNAQRQMFEAMASAMDGNTVPLPTHLNNSLAKALYDTYRRLPLGEHLHARLIDGHDLNSRLASRLLHVDGINHRVVLAKAADDLPEHRVTIQNAVRCENLLAILEAIFEWLCASKGKKVEAAVANLPVDLEALETACASFGDSGNYQGHAAIVRQRRFHDGLDTSNPVALANSVLHLHQEISEDRGRSPWVWEEKGVLHADVDFDRPSRDQLRVGLAWRNDYYLAPLQRIARQLAETRR